MRAQRAEVSPVTEVPQESEDKALTLAFKSGDPGAYQAIYERYSPRVQRVCRRMLNQPEDAQEAAQEAFLRVYQALGRFNGRYQLGAWISRIATNVCLDQLRAQTRRPADSVPDELLELRVEPRDESNPEVIALRRAEGRRVRRILDQLPPMHRAAIVLRDFEGLSYEEVAIALGITDTQVKALLHRARKGFRRQWDLSGVASILIPTRLWQRVRNVDHAGSTSVGQSLTSGMQTASACGATIVQQCGSFVAERGAALLTGGALGLATVAGGVAATHDPSPQPPLEAHLTTVAQDAPAVETRERDRTKPERRQVVADVPAEEEPTVDEPTTDPTEAPPAVEPSPSPTETAPPEEEPGGGGEPGGGEVKPQPDPTEPPAPPAPWFSMQTAKSVAFLCNCETAPQLITQSLSGVKGERFDFSQQAVGAATDAEGDAAYRLSANYRGSVDGTYGNLSMRFTLSTSGGDYTYEASGYLDHKEFAERGVKYVFVGDFQIVSGPAPFDSVPHQGKLTGEFSFASDDAAWTDGSALYRSAFSLR